MPSRSPALRIDEVHVWRVGLDIPAGELERRVAWLAVDERGRASRFRNPLDRRRYVAHRSALREILGAYLGLEARQVQLDRDRLGKPRLAGEAGTGWQFSVSHSGDFGLVAVRRGRQVGVDVEQVILGFDWREVAALALSEREWRGIGARPADRQCEAFFAIWTRKEALAKAVGLGLRIEFPVLQVPADRCLGGWSVLRFSAEEGDVECAVVDLPVGEGFRASLASVGGTAHLRGFYWMMRDSSVTDQVATFGAQPIPEKLEEGRRAPLANVRGSGGRGP
jgi:4'-phosphopantetheinyl transferase